MVRTAAAAGLLAGLLLTGVQHLQVTGIIARAEVLESAAPPAPAVHTHADGEKHTHEAQHAAGHESGHESAHDSGHE
ncbi:MAG TPA: CbtA family protein, partial [Duganella sp.]|nr:CbtA family protein [Duganella sp.]